MRTNEVGTKQLSVGGMLTLALMLVQPSVEAAGPSPVNLGSAAHFTILSGAAITTTGGGIINGDVGASPITGAAIHLTQAQVNGTIYTVDAGGPPGSVIAPALLDTAKSDLTTAMNEAAGRTPIPSGEYRNPGAGNIGGMTLIPGLYKFDSTASISGNDLTLEGGPNDVWIFQIAADLQVASEKRVMLAGGAQARNIFWQVGTDAVIGTFAVFKGTILAAQSITMNTSSSMEGRALAFTAGVVFNGDGGVRPIPEAPSFENVSVTSSNAVITLITTPYFSATLQSSPDLSPLSWTAIGTITPVTSPWIFTNSFASTTVTQRFYRAFITP
jgi:hypothetical protein